MKHRSFLNPFSNKNWSIGLRSSFNSFSENLIWFDFLLVNISFFSETNRFRYGLLNFKFFNFSSWPNCLDLIFIASLRNVEYPIFIFDSSFETSIFKVSSNSSSILVFRGKLLRGRFLFPRSYSSLVFRISSRCSLILDNDRLNSKVLNTDSESWKILTSDPDSDTDTRFSGTPYTNSDMDSDKIMTSDTDTSSDTGTNKIGSEWTLSVEMTKRKSRTWTKIYLEIGFSDDRPLVVVRSS